MTRLTSRPASVFVEFDLSVSITPAQLAFARMPENGSLVLDQNLECFLWSRPRLRLGSTDCLNRAFHWVGSDRGDHNDVLSFHRGRAGVVHRKNGLRAGASERDVGRAVERRDPCCSHLPGRRTLCTSTATQRVISVLKVRGARDFCHSLDSATGTPVHDKFS